jgi:hypothetical protein
MRATRSLALVASATLSALIGVQARAAVVDAAPDRFSLAVSFETQASPDAAFSALTDISLWWAPDQTSSGHAIAMSLDTTPGGCLCEAWPDGLTKHAEVVQVRFGTMIRLVGAMGPLQELGVSEVQDLTVEPSSAGARVKWTASVKGVPSDRLQMIAPVVDALIVDQMGRLQRYLATGSPEPEE